MAKVFEWERLDSGFVIHVLAKFFFVSGYFFLIRIYWSDTSSDEVAVLKLRELCRY